MAQWNDILKAWVVLYTISLTTSLKNLGKTEDNALAFLGQFASKDSHFQRQNSSPCGSGESDVVIKHLIPVVRRSAALFMLSGFRSYRNMTGTYIFFVQM